MSTLLELFHTCTLGNWTFIFTFFVLFFPPNFILEDLYIKYFYLIQIICTRIYSTILPLRVRVDVWFIVTKGCSTLCRALEQKPHLQDALFVIPRAPLLGGSFTPLQRIQSEHSKPRRLGSSWKIISLWNHMMYVIYFLRGHIGSIFKSMPDTVN